MTRIETRRLVLVPATLELVRAELEHPSRLEALLEARISPGWPPGEYDRSALEFFQSLLERDGERSDGWLSWYVMTAEPENPPTLVAGAGYLGPPEEGTVEIGYSVVPEARGYGFATEIVDALVRHAFDTGRVQRIVAEAARSNAASHRVLERNGFVLVGPGRDAESVRFEKRRPVTG
jgi:RimJ/RimL family protein N-acetyltransferase